MKNFLKFLASGAPLMLVAGSLSAGVKTHFIPNVGQYGADVLYGSFPAGVTLRTDGANVSGVRITFVETKKADIVPLHKSEGVFNYYVGKDPSSWKTGISSYASVKYDGLYDGIDLTFVGTGEGVEFHWTVEPGANPKDIKVALNGGKVSIEDGALVVKREGAELFRISPPEAYQGSNPVSVSYVLDGNVLSLRVGEYDPHRTLVIDPRLSNLPASTFLGGSSSERGVDVAITPGAVYVVGNTSSTDFPGSGSLNGGSDAFVAKFSRDLSTLLAAAYYGGGDYDHAFGVATDGNDVFVVGITQSNNLPTPGGIFPSYGGNQDGFVAKFDINLNLLSATYLGGSQYDKVESVEFDGTAVYVTGITGSSNFPVQNGYDLTHNGVHDIFLAKFVSLSTPPDATFLGGSDYDWGLDIKHIPGYVGVVGWTSSTNYPTQNAYDNTFNGNKDAVVSVLTDDLNTLVISTYIGGSGDDRAYGLDTTSGTDMVVVGWTSSPNFPTVGSSTSLNGVGDAFVLRLSGNTLITSSYMGGSDNDVADKVFVEGTNAFVVGHTGSSDFPIRPGAYDNTFGGLVDAFITRFDLTTDSLEESTYLGGLNDDEAYAVAVSGDSVYVVGVTGSSSFPANAYDTSLAGYDGFVSMFTRSVATGVEERHNVGNSLKVYEGAVEVSLSRASYVGMDVYSSIGRIVGSVTAGFLPEGKHSILLPDLPRGKYVLKIRIGKEVKAIKIVR
jgi:hypothetical protein